MNEKEQLTENIIASHGIMQKIDSLEDEIIELETKKRKAKGALGFCLYYIVFACIGGFILGVLSKLPFISGVSIIGEGMMFLIFIFPIAAAIVVRIIIGKFYDGRISESNSKLVALVNDPVLNWLPLAYRDSVSYSYISSYIQNMRANSLQEAINLFEIEKHQARLEAKTENTIKISLFR